MEPKGALAVVLHSHQGDLADEAAVAALHRDDDDGQTRIPQGGALAAGALYSSTWSGPTLRRWAYSPSIAVMTERPGCPFWDAPRDARRYGPNMRFEPTELTTDELAP
jgi:hypothetical protein